jgi:uncharacterized cysteine cluster protein YcgN (CxxCxxCC family)
MNKFQLSAIILVLGFVSASYATEDFIKVVPGNYSFTTTRSNMNPNPKIETEDDCITQESVNIKEFLPDPDSCSTSNVNKNGNSLSFDIKCSGGQMPPMKGKAEISATSSTVESHYKIVGSFQGQEFSVNSDSKGQRTGDCE